MDLIGKMRQSVRFCLNNPGQLGAGAQDNYGVLLTTRGYLRQQGGNRAVSAGEIEGETKWLLTTRFQQAIAANISISTKLIIDNVWYTLESWNKPIDGSLYYNFVLNRKEPVTGVVADLVSASEVGVKSLYLSTVPGTTSVSMGVGGTVLLVARSGTIYNYTTGAPGNFQFAVAGQVISFENTFNSGEIVYVMYKDA